MGTTDHSSDSRETPDVSGIGNPEVAHERSDVNVRAVLWFMAGLIATAVVVHLLMWGLFDVFESKEAHAEPPPASRLGVNTQRLPPEPRLQLAPGHESHPAEDLQKLRAEEDNRLHGYGWVDEQRGVVHIPIEQAKKLLIERSHSAAQQSALPEEAMPADSGSGRMPEKSKQ
ncbi:MAG TPA: hypothetical protein VFD58_28335 [Blastocatellia bacterium]|nr:hypothetical protein [Blastocatellia bacterium]